MADLVDHFDDHHLEGRERAELRGDPIRCYHPKCKDGKFLHLNHFGNHVQTTHGVPLRSSDQVKQRRLRKAKRRQMMRKWAHRGFDGAYFVRRCCQAT